MASADYPLASCPGTPNCVSSDPDDPNPSRSLPPIPFDGAAAAAIDRMSTVLAEMPGCRIVQREPRRLRCEFRSRIFRFVDDVELVAVPHSPETGSGGGILHFRSASRLGRWDVGANRRRMDRIRHLFERRSD